MQRDKRYRCVEPAETGALRRLQWKTEVKVRYLTTRSANDADKSWPPGAALGALQTAPTGFSLLPFVRMIVGRVREIPTKFWPSSATWP